MPVIFADLETYSEVPIKHGLFAYAEKAEVLLLAYAVDDGPVGVYDYTITPGEMTAFHVMARDPDYTFVFHNAQFDVTVLRHALGIEIPLERVHCTMAQALSHGLPGSLGTLSEIYNLPTDKAKDKAGKQLIQLFCKPRPKNSKIRRATCETHPAEWQQFIDYARLDIEATRVLHRKLPRWNYPDREHSLWCLDQQINARGVAVDLRLAEGAVRAVARAQEHLAGRARSLTNGEVEAATQRDAMIAHILKEYGVSLPDMQAGTLERRLEDPEMPGVLKELLSVRLAASTTSTSKYLALLNAISSDGRLRGTLQYCGASRTGRWAGRTFQPQNLPRPTMKQEEIDEGIEALTLGCAELITDDVMRLTSNAIRGCLVAPPGRKLVVSDLSNIEGRVLAWLADESWKLDAFRAFDRGAGPDLYKLAYARSFGIDAQDVTKEQRQLGKVQELALGYQGAVGAFSSMARLYGMDLPEDKVLLLVKAWRKANANIASFWYELEDAAVRAIRNVGTTIECRKLRVRRDGSWLRVVLPSGRSLCYASPRLEDGKISYMGMNQYSRKWERLRTYGGKLVENATQAVARDVMAANMPLIERQGFEIVLTVHDEIITEAPDDERFSARWLSLELANKPAWATDLPLAAGGFETHRYRKD